MDDNLTETAESLTADLAGVADWPKMAQQFARAIDTVRSHERVRLVLLARIAARDKRIGELEAEIQAWSQAQCREAPAA